VRPWNEQAAFEWDAQRMLRASILDELDDDEDAEIEFAYTHDLATIQNLPEVADPSDPRAESPVERVRRYTER
jgi:hypothetical protein